MGLVLNAFDNYCNKVTLRKKLAKEFTPNQGYAGSLIVLDFVRKH